MNDIAVHAQKEWIAAHGGDLEGYRREYAHTLDGHHGTNPDAIYYADINHLRRLQGHPTFLIEHDEAVRVLGEGYFA